MISYYFRFLILMFLPCINIAQVADNFIMQPSINVRWDNTGRWRFNSAIEHRSKINNGWEALHIQATQFASYEVGFYSQIGVGVMYREIFDDELPEELRFTEQFVYARKYNDLKVAHRLRWDQRIRGERLTHRWRYRLSASIPLNGDTVDVTEYYVTSSIESIFKAQVKEKPGYDQRVALGIGRALDRKIKLQLMTEYRWENYTQDITRSVFLYLGVFYSL
ncbi:DUF2490 domain-containing protein [Nonlabens mediterrranea]|uniref:DUF2490 domain-containing protein n=1 Tax=Nonlabens mediterrranea TaxID=1419947 RepID=A0ABS0A3G4_9FLAO|nr:hypothetical protein BBFL7_01717 [Flavobacteria bacterium BBFL7]MBF4983901.1 DUF2490 domain-containing protein [Nonlabens mediterrranea]